MLCFRHSDVLRRCLKVMRCVPPTPAGTSLAAGEHHADKHITFHAVEHIVQKSHFCPVDKSGIFVGAPAGTRTPDTLLKRQVLYLLSYWGGLAGMAGPLACGQAASRLWTATGSPFTPARFSSRSKVTRFLWLGWRDSNPLYRSQSPVCYHYTTSQYGAMAEKRGLGIKAAGKAASHHCGVGYGARTHDTRNHNPVLYQLS